MTFLPASGYLVLVQILKRLPYRYIGSVKEYTTTVTTAQVMPTLRKPDESSQGEIAKVKVNPKKLRMTITPTNDSIATGR